jgi:hypothetical protein
MAIYNTRAHENAANNSVALTRRGYLTADQMNQMCDGRVSLQNLRQAEQAMSDARMNGDGYGYRLASSLADNVKLALRTQLRSEEAGYAPYGETKAQGYADADRDRFFSQQGVQVQGMPGFDPNASTAERIGYVAGSAIATYAIGELFSRTMRSSSRRTDWNDNWGRGWRPERRPVDQRRHQNHDHVEMRQRRHDEVRFRR